MKKLFTLMLTALGAAALPSATIAADIPYTVNFYHNADVAKDCANNCETWIAFDKNGDSCGWTHYVGSYNDGHWQNKMFSSRTETDDYLYSPEFAFDAGTQYQVELWIYSNGSDGKKRPIELLLAQTTDGSDGTKLGDLKPEEGWSTAKDRKKAWNSDELLPLQTVTFTVETAGTYRLALHSYGTKAEIGYGELRLKEFSLQALQKAAAPGAVSNLKVTPGAQGEATATISLTAPSTDASGAALEGNVKIKLYREDEETPFFTSEEIAAGSEFNHVDTEAYEGETWYTVKAENGSGEGPASEAAAWIGVDVPSAPTTVTATIVNGKVKVSWTAPSEAQHGGYIDFANLSYNVSRIIDGEMSQLPAVNGTEFTDAELADADQVNVVYEVQGTTSGGLGQSAQSNRLNYGRPLSLPFAESFANQQYTTTPWAQEAIHTIAGQKDPQWDLIEKREGTQYGVNDDDDEIPFTIVSQDTDKGFAHYNSEVVGRPSESATGRLIFPSVDFSDKVNPTVKFYVHQNNYDVTDPATAPSYSKRDNYVTVEASADNGKFEPVEGFEFHTYSNTPGWVECEVPLAKFAGKGRVQVALVGHGSGGGSIYVDNVTISEGKAEDVIAISISAPSRVRIGATANIAVSYKNAGGKELKDYTVELVMNGAPVASEAGITVAPGKTATHTFNYSPKSGNEGSYTLSANIVYAADADQSNNSTEEIAMNVTSPLLPGVKSISGTLADSKLTLSWGKPNYIEAEALIEEDGFEGYEPFAINTFGDFTSFDNDGRVTWGLTGVSYDNHSEKMAYQVFTPVLIEGLDAAELEQYWKPNSGSTMLLSPQALDGSNAATSDDWLVFPALSGNAQTIKFHARAANPSYSEYIQGLYSMAASASEPDDYQGCLDGGGTNYAVSGEWKEYSYNVPKGAKRFAIRHTSQDGLALLIDDVTYERSVPDANSLGHQGYNVYCNGEKLNDEPIAERSYTTELPTGKVSHNYTVCAAYPSGESSASEPYVLDQTGIEDLTGGETSVATDGLKVLVSNAEGKELKLYSIAGLTADEATGTTGTSTLSANAAGVYVLTVGDKAYKLVLK